MYTARGNYFAWLISESRSYLFRSFSLHHRAIDRYGLHRAIVALLGHRLLRLGLRSYVASSSATNHQACSL
jgi:hypothetical protein